MELTTIVAGTNIIFVYKFQSLSSDLWLGSEQLESYNNFKLLWILIFYMIDFIWIHFPFANALLEVVAITFGGW